MTTDRRMLARVERFWAQGYTKDEALESVQHASKDYLSVRDYLLQHCIVQKIGVAI